MMERRRARRVALELLYQVEVRGATVDEILTSRQQVSRQTTPEFTFRIVRGVASNLTEIDKLIDRYADHWSIDRMPIIDRNVLRICVYEMMFESDVPVGVAINEAVELAKAYGTDDSSKFVNGLVARIAQELRERNREAREELRR